MKELDEYEKEIITVKERRSGKKYNVSFIEYRKPTHRSTLCFLANSLNPMLSEVVIGEAVLKSNDIDNQSVGAVVSFIKALNSIEG
ncbi:MAG: hypothetical protein ABIC57_01365 [bacterium]